MAFSTAASRFSLLTDDAADPFAKKGKAKPQNGTASKGTKPGTATTTAQKKAKDKKPVTGQTVVSNKVKVQKMSVNGDGGDTPGSKPKTQNNSSVDDQKSKPKSVLGWEAWEQRDNEFVTLEYQSQLEEALLQSKLEFQKEQQLQKQREQPCGTGENGDSKPKNKKKKKVAVPICQLTEALSLNSDTNSSVPTAIDEESLIARLRHETQLEMLREKQNAEERQLLVQRNAHFLNGNANPVIIPEDHTCGGRDEQDLKTVIVQLETDKQALVQELDGVKARFKKLLGLLNDSELKQKVHLQHDLEKVTESNQELTKLNQDLNDELKNAYSQLEQEKSRAHAALMEVKKMSEQTRRNHGRTQSQQELLP